MPDNAKLSAQKGDLIISKVRPNRGAIAIIDYEGDDLVVSGAFTVLREKYESTFCLQVLQVLLRTELYKELMLQANIGTQYPIIRDEDIIALPIPLINSNIQQTIATMIEQSFTLKARSEFLLELAKSAVEMAIEQNEDAALHLIKEATINE